MSPSTRLVFRLGCVLQAVFMLSLQIAPLAQAATLVSQQTQTQSVSSSPTQLSGYDATKALLDGSTTTATATTTVQNTAVQGLSTGRVLFVSTTGLDSNNGSETAAWKTLKYAVSQLKAGDTLYIQEGTYNETVDLTTSGTATSGIYIVGLGNVVIDNTGAYYYDSAIDTNNQSYVNIRNLKITNSRGIQVTGGQYVNISGISSDKAQFCVLMKNAAFVTITNCTAVNSRHAFRGEGTTHDVTMDNIKASGSQDVYTGMDMNYLNGDGVIMESDTYNITITNMESFNHWDAGLDIKSDNVVLKNIVSYGNKNGLKLWGANISLENVLVYDTKFQANTTLPEGIGVNIRSGSVKMKNVTIADSDGTDIKVNTGATLNLENSIVVRKYATGKLLEKYGTMTEKGVVWFRQGKTTPDFTIATGSLWVDPQFVDWAAKDFRLKSTSPALALGTNPAPGALPVAPMLNPYINGIYDNKEVSGVIFVTANPEWADKAKNANYYIDGRKIGPQYTKPYQMGGEDGYDTTKLANGWHTLEGYLTLYNNTKVKFTIKFYVNN